MKNTGIWGLQLTGTAIKPGDRMTFKFRPVGNGQAA